MSSLRGQLVLSCYVLRTSLMKKNVVFTLNATTRKIYTNITTLIRTIDRIAPLTGKISQRGWITLRSSY